jgi:tRNA(Ile2) C34 agmatinyltransferase TiaS
MTNPLRYDSVTMICPVCSGAFDGSGRSRYCSDACKQKAWRDKRAQPPLTRRVAPIDTVYLCPQCETRYLGDRRCPDCNLFTNSLGRGAACPYCDEPIALVDIIPDYQPNPRRPR